MTEPRNAESRGFQSPALPDHTHKVVDAATTRDSSKAIAILKARFAIAGHLVHEGSNNDFIVTRWGMSRHVPDLAALRMFARSLGATK